jgi:REP element-mobilizing transposase RayT
MEINRFNPDIHHRHGVRLKGYDYSRRGMYFITICTYEREHLFGEIQNGVLHHNAQALLAAIYWNGITNHYPNIIPHEFIAMPNHIHGILEMASEPESPEPPVGARFIAPWSGIRNAQPRNAQTRDTQPRNAQPRDAQPCGAQNQGAMNRAPTGGGATGNDNPMLHDTLGRMIRWYKGRVTFECRRRNLPFAWQRNYYEHIIRNRQDHAGTADYIVSNPANWLDDCFYEDYDAS